MKKTAWIMVMLVISTVAMAQKGSFYIGGIVGFSSSTYKAPNGNKSGTSSWAFAPEAGTFLQDDIQLGISLGIGGSNTKNNGNDTETESTISPTVYSRKFFKLTDNFSTFAGLYLDFISGKTTDHTVTPAEESKESGFGARVGVGVAYAFSPRFTAVGQYGLLGFQSVKNKVDGNDAGTDTDFDFGVNTVGTGSVFNIGLYYTFKTAQ